MQIKNIFSLHESRTVLVVDLKLIISEKILNCLMWQAILQQFQKMESFSRNKPFSFLQINNRISAKPPSFLNYFLNSKCWTACSVCYATSSYQSSALKRFFFSFFKDLINSHNQMQLSRGKRAASSVYLLPPWAFTPHPLFAALAGGPLGPLNLDCLAVFQTGFFFCWETEVY